MSRRTEKNVGVIGLGIIGSRVAENLRRRGFHVFVWNRTPRPFPNFVGSRGEVADLCDVIQIFVSDDDALLETVEAMKRSLKSHHVVMAHSTVAPHTMRAAAEIVQRRGAQFLDAPFTGSKGAAEKGELVYYIGGDEAAFRRARAALEGSSKEIVEIGEIGQATTVKVATNMITAATVQSAAEALALVHSAGLAPEKFTAAMRGNGSQSGTLAMKLPKMIDGDFEPHFSVKHMLKDVEIAARLAQSHGLRFPASDAARDSLRAEVKEGRGDLDYASVVHVFFPDGSLLRQAKDAAAEAEQQTLGGLDAEPASDASAADAGSIPEAVAESDADDIKDAAVVREDLGDHDETTELRDDEARSAAGKESDGEVIAAESRVEKLADKSATSEPEEASSETADAGSLEEGAVTQETAAMLVEERSSTADAEVVAPKTDAAPPAEASKNGGSEPRRGMFSRIFGKAGDS